MSEQFFEQRGHATIVTGGQFGSEGKGAITNYLAMEDNYDVSVRGGSSNAGHTVVFKGKAYKNQLLPVAWTAPSTKLMIAPAAIVDADQLDAEIQWAREAGVPVEDRLYVDRNAGAVTKDHIQQEIDRGLGGKIGSTVHGCGAALVSKLWRDGSFVPAVSLPQYKPYRADVSFELNQRLQQGQRALLEGTQGTMLSLNHSPYYPFGTSRDCTALAIANEAGLGTRRIGEIVMVVRSYPIRVGGNSGPTGAKEITFDEIGNRRGAPLEVERTTVTKKVRRIFEFSMEDLMTAVRLNQPTQLALTFADYFDARAYGATNVQSLPESVIKRIKQIGQIAGVPVTLIQTSPNTTIDLRLSGGL